MRRIEVTDDRREAAVAPEPADPYLSDPLLRSWLRRQLGGEDRPAASRLVALSAEVAGTLRAAHLQAEAHPPRLVRYDPDGERVDRVETPAGWEAHRQAAARHALVALPYLPGPRAQWGTATRVVQHALLHLYGPESATYSCPVAMTDGAAALLRHPEVDPTVRDAWLPRLVATDPTVAITSGQWMTEVTGGSDLSEVATTARPAGDGSWRLTGEKWFCSAVDAPVAVVLARPAGAERGSRSLAPFLVPRYRDDGGPAPGLRLHRLKDKLGTRALPTAEVGLREAYALPLGDPTRSGLARMMTLVRVARLHNAAAAAAGMRRGLSYAHAFAGTRRVAGGRLATSALHRATLATLGVDTAGAFVLAGHAFALLGRVEVTGDGDPAAAAELRLVAPLAKLATARLAVSAASELLECFGGAGYVEDTGIPRLLRDAQVLPIWEGTTNVLALDARRAVLREGAADPVLARLDAAARAAPALAGPLPAATAGLRAELAALAADPDPALPGARGLALRLSYALAAALLIAQAAAGDEVAAVAARLWGRRWLAGEDIATDAHRHADLLCAHS